AIILSALFYLLIPFVVYRIAVNNLNMPPVWSLVASLLVVLSGRLAWSALSGMETSLAALLATLSIEAHLRGRSETKVLWIEAIWLGLGFLVRPEIGFLILLALADWLLLRRKE